MPNKLLLLTFTRILGRTENDIHYRFNSNLHRVCLMEEAMRHSFVEWLEDRDISESEYEEIKEWFAQFDVKMF